MAHELGNSWASSLRPGDPSTNDAIMRSSRRHLHRPKQYDRDAVQTVTELGRLALPIHQHPAVNKSSPPVRAPRSRSAQPGQRPTTFQWSGDRAAILRSRQRRTSTTLKQAAHDYEPIRARVTGQCAPVANSAARRSRWSLHSPFDQRSTTGQTIASGTRRL